MGFSSFLPLARFHLRVGTRLAVRAAAPLAGLPVALVLLQQDPSGALRALAGWLLGRQGGIGAGVVTAALCLLLAGWAAPRVTGGLAGWPRHLPVTQTLHRRAALAAIATAQAPLVIGLLLLLPAAASRSGGIAPGRLALLPFATAAAAIACWPGVPAARSRLPAGAALLLAATGRLLAVPFVLTLVLLAERLAGPLATRGARRRRSSDWPLPLLLAVRALGLGALGAVLVSLAPVAAMALLRLNNDLPAGVAAGAARLGAGAGVVVCLAVLTERLAHRRPVWPWSRSLPVASLRRVGEDATLVALPCLLPLAAAAWLAPLAALTVAACLPTLALLAAGALRPASPAESGRTAGLLVAGALVAAWVALLPALALLVLAAAPLAARGAAARERRQKVSRWDERHHLAVGDPLSWSAR